MYTLYIDTHFVDLVLSLFKDENVVETIKIENANHSDIAIGLIAKLLEENNLEVADLKSIIVINKSDLAEDEEEKNLAKIYENIGYSTIITNAKDSVGIDKLKEKLNGETSVFAGNSGVGKSTIINSLFNNKITEEGEISEKNKKGKNTTTLVRIYELEKDTFIADAPGFSTFDIFEIEKEDLSHYFIEFVKYMDKCSYVGCSHVNESENECQVKKAFLEGKISKSRYDNYCKIYEELKNYKKW